VSDTDLPFDRDAHKNSLVTARFDQRPGDLEASRGLVDPRKAYMVWGERGPQGWQVRVKCDKALTAEQAFELAAEICRIGELIEGRDPF
jgi:hypothetical protein